MNNLYAINTQIENQKYCNCRGVHRRRIKENLSNYEILFSVIHLTSGRDTHVVQPI